MAESKKGAVVSIVKDEDAPDVPSASSGEPDRRFDDIEAPSSALKVMLDCRVAKNGEEYPLRTQKNLMRILEADPRWAYRIEYNELMQSPTFDRKIVTDDIERDISVGISVLYDVDFHEKEVGREIHRLSRCRKFDPVREYLDVLEWDETPRIEGWLHKHLAIPDTPLTRAYASMFLLGAVARVMCPGSKLDTVLVLVGGQGARKTSTFEALFGQSWHVELTVDTRSKDAVIGMNGSWCVEWGELDTLKRSQTSAIKGFISKRKDVLRLPYGRNNTTQPRRVVFAGTTNEMGFLTDPTGSRRFWCVEIPKGHRVDIEKLEKERDQLWAEAYLKQQLGAKWWLSEELEAEREQESRRFQSVDPWLEVVRAWMASNPSRTGYLASDVLQEALDKNVSMIRRGDEMRLGTVLRELGYERARRQVDGLRCWRWVRS